MATEQRCSVRFLVFGASMREGSMNDRLASLAAGVVEQKGGSVERATMTDFDHRLGERPDDETTRVELGETAAAV